MLTYNRLIKHPKAFKSLTGLSLEEFEKLYERFEPAWEEAEEKRLTRRNRQRGIGGGANYSITPRSLLMMTLMWLRTYMTTDTLGALFDCNKSTISRNTRRVLAVLHQLSETTFCWPDSSRKGLTLEQAIAQYPELLAVVDVTEQHILRPQDRQREHKHYSGKRRLSTAKNAIFVNEVGVIRAVSRSFPGRTHDLTLLRDCDILKHIPKQLIVVGDSAFHGLDNDLPYHRLAIAFKGQRNHPLTPEMQLANKMLSSQRIIVENVFAHLKKFRILADRFRHAIHTVHSAVFCVVASLVNRQAQLRLERLAH